MGESTKYINLSDEEVFDKYSDTVYRLAFSRTKSKHDADDILGEVFLRYIKSTPKFSSEEHVKFWLIRATINCSKSFLTSSWVKKIVPLEDSLYTTMKENSEVYYAVMKLPVKYRTAVHLYYYEGYSVKEIADILKVSESAIKSRLSRAREQLKKELEGEMFCVRR